MLVQLEQVDEILPYLDSPDPEVSHEAKAFIAKFDKENTFPHGLCQVLIV